MKINQKYFALRDANGLPAPHFAFMANLAAEDLGKAIVTGNERVLRARLADARHFWDLDIKSILSTDLEDVMSKLAKITFHTKIGSQADRITRLQIAAIEVATALGGTEDEIENSNAAALFCKVDLISLMVGEFPELQGIIGSYYAERMTYRWKQEDIIDSDVVGRAIKTHYQPKGPSDAVPTGIVAISVALADKLDTLRTFFSIGEKPTGSGDPYALRRCALGVIRIILENGLRLPLKQLLGSNEHGLFDFIIERLRVKLRGEGKRFDILDAVLAAGSDDDLVRLMKRVDALTEMLVTEDGKNLLAGYKRAANILRIENARDGPHDDDVDEVLLNMPEYRPDLELSHAILMAAGPNGRIKHAFDTEDFGGVIIGLAILRPYIDAFFEKVTVNAEPPELRRNRLRLLAQFVGAVQHVADFTKIEG
jgi:glycyl-tRNA synthetase beta chain